MATGNLKVTTQHDLGIIEPNEQDGDIQFGYDGPLSHEKAEYQIDGDSEWRVIPEGGATIGADVDRKITVRVHTGGSAGPCDVFEQATPEPELKLRWENDPNIPNVTIKVKTTGIY